MATKKFTKMEYKAADELVFGEAKYPQSYGLGMTVGGGMLVPESTLLLGQVPRRTRRP